MTGIQNLGTSRQVPPVVGPSAVLQTPISQTCSHAKTVATRPCRAHLMGSRIRRLSLRSPILPLHPPHPLPFTSSSAIRRRTRRRQKLPQQIRTSVVVQPSTRPQISLNVEHHPHHPPRRRRKNRAVHGVEFVKAHKGVLPWEDIGGVCESSSDKI